MIDKETAMKRARRRSFNAIIQGDFKRDDMVDKETAKKICDMFELRNEDFLTITEIRDKLGLSRRVVDRVIRENYNVHEREEHRGLSQSKVKFGKAVNIDALHAEIERLFDIEGSDIVPMRSIARKVGVSLRYVMDYIYIAYDEDVIARHNAKVMRTIHWGSGR
jgi:hypothetical protein